MRTALFLISMPAMIHAFATDPPTGRFLRLGPEDDLASSIVNVVYQDRLGYIWIGGENGLERYDGRHLLHFDHDPDDPTSLSADHVTDIAEDQDGTLWVTTRGGGLNRFDWSTGRANRVALASNRLTKVALAYDKTMWLASEDKGLIQYRPEQDEVLKRWRHEPGRATSLSADRVLDFVLSTGDRVWVGTERGLDLLDSETGEIEQLSGTAEFPLRDIPIRTLAMRGTRILIGTARGLAAMNTSTRDIEVLLRDRVPTTIFFQETRLWVGTAQNGLALLLDGQWTHYRHHPNLAYTLAADEVRTLGRDRSGNLWIGTRGGGLSTLDVKPVLFRSYEPDRARGDTDIFRGVSAIADAGEGKLWIGSVRTGSGLGLFDRETGAVKRFEPDPMSPTSLTSGRVLSLLVDSDETLWVGTFAGLERYDGPGKGFTRFTESDGLSHNSVYAMMEDRTGTIWCGTDNGLTWMREGELERVRDPAIDGRINALFEDERGDVWLGLSPNGLVRYVRAENRFLVASDAPEAPKVLRDFPVYAIAEKEGLWIGTDGGGLVHLSPEGRYQVYDRRRGLLNDHVGSVLAGEGNRIWVGNAEGLSSFTPELRSFFNYDQMTGVQDGRFERGAALRTTDGELFFGGTGGVTYFHTCCWSRCRD